MNKTCPEDHFIRCIKAPLHRPTQPSGFKLTLVYTQHPSACYVNPLSFTPTQVHNKDPYTTQNSRKELRNAGTVSLFTHYFVSGRNLVHVWDGT